MGIDHKALKTRIVRHGAGVVQEPTLNRVILGDCPRDLDLAALVQAVRDQADGGLRQRPLRVDRRVSARHEEPQPVFHDRTAERAFVDSRDFVEMHHGHSARALEWRLCGPGGIEKIHPHAAREAIAAALRDRVDDAAAEPAVLGGDAGRQHLRLLDRILDEERSRRCEQVVVDVDAVDHEDVVEGEGAIDDQLTRIGTVLGQARRQRRNAGNRSRRRQGFDLFPLEVRADDRRGNGRRCLAHHLHGFGQGASPQRGVLFDHKAERDGDVLRRRRESLQPILHQVVARRQCLQHILALRVGDCGPWALQRG